MKSKNKKDNIQLENYACRKCGCTHTTPCYNKNYGYCWWVNKEKTLCSHCFHGLPLSNRYQIEELIQEEKK